MQAIVVMNTKCVCHQVLSFSCSDWPDLCLLSSHVAHVPADRIPPNSKEHSKNHGSPEAEIAAATA